MKNILEVVRKRFKFILYVVYFTVACGSAAFAFEIQTGGCIVSGVESDSVIIRSVAAAVSESQQYFESFFNVKLAKPPVRIEIPQDENDFTDKTHSRLPEWSAGVTFSSQRRIVINPGSVFDSQRYREILLHELAHIYLAEACDPSSIPLWFNEGIAMYISGKTISWGDAILIGNALAAKQIIEINEIDSLLSFGPNKARLAYLQSFLAVRYLIDQYNELIIRQLMGTINAGARFDSALLQLTGKDLIDFEYDLYQEIRNNYRWMTFLQFEHIFWVLVVSLIILSFVIMKMRNRRKIREWDLAED